MVSLNLFKKRLPSWLPYALAVMGAILYLIQAVAYAHTTISTLDEGSYLIKGFYYATGVYEPFEPYGPLTNKAPLAFIFYGLAEVVFGAGLRTGRFFAIFLALLTILGTWIVSRRWGGNWLAAGSVWFFALSAMIVKLHSQALSQVIISCILAWICVLVLDEQPRPLWQIMLASAMAAAAVFTRQNLAPFLPLLILYVLWQHGWRSGLWSFMVASVVFLAFHAYYWPRVMGLWAPWLPEALTPFLDIFRLPSDAVPVWDPQLDFFSRLSAFFQGVRYHFLPLLGSLLGLMFFAPRAQWKSAAAFRAATFLAVSYILLAALHGWASLASQYESYSCVFCFSNYLGFFDPLGILFFIILFRQGWNQTPHRWVTTAIILLVLVTSTGMGYSAFEQVGSGLMNLPVLPRFRAGQFLPDWAGLADTLHYGLGLETGGIKRVIAALVGLLFGLALLFISMIWRNRNQAKPFAVVLVNIYLGSSLILAPLLNTGAKDIECKMDIIKSHEELGAYLASVIPPDSLVYWDGGNAFTPMIYVSQARIFPPQINGGYTFRVGGDPEVLYSFSHWNSALVERWQAEADIFIIEGQRYASWKEFLSPDDFQEFARPQAAPSCIEGSELRIFQRLP